MAHFEAMSPLENSAVLHGAEETRKEGKVWNVRKAGDRNDHPIMVFPRCGESMQALL